MPRVSGLGVLLGHNDITNMRIVEFSTELRTRLEVCRMTPRYNSVFLRHAQEGAVTHQTD